MGYQSGLKMVLLLGDLSFMNSKDILFGTGSDPGIRAFSENGVRLCDFSILSGCHLPLGA